jgi:hypothetical protein
MHVLLLLYALQAALPAPLGGLAAPVFYLDTEGKFSSGVSSGPHVDKTARAHTHTLLQFVGTTHMLQT